MIRSVEKPYDYSVLAPFYDDFKKDDDYDRFFSMVAPLLSESLHFSTPSCCDIGTGTGEMAIRISNYGIDTVGIDRSPEMIELARKKSVDKPISFEVADATAEIPGGNYSTITMFDDIINCMTSVESVSILFNNIFFSLAPGGILVFDLVGRSAFKNYMSTVSFFERDNISRLTWPATRDDDLDDSIYTMNYIIIRKEGPNYPSLLGTISEYYYEPDVVERIAAKAGFELAGRFSLTSNSLTSIGALDAYDGYKLVYKFRKGGNSNYGNHPGDREAS